MYTSNTYSFLGRSPQPFVILAVKLAFLIYIWHPLLGTSIISHSKLHKLVKHYTKLQLHNNFENCRVTTVAVDDGNLTETHNVANIQILNLKQTKKNKSIS